MDRYCGSPGDALRLTVRAFSKCSGAEGHQIAFQANGANVALSPIAAGDRVEDGSQQSFSSTVPAVPDGTYEVRTVGCGSNLGTPDPIFATFQVPCASDAGSALSDGATNDATNDDGGTPANVGGIMTLRVNLTAGGANAFGYGEVFLPPTDAAGAEQQASIFRELAFTATGGEVPVGTCAKKSAPGGTAGTPPHIDFGDSISFVPSTSVSTPVVTANKTVDGAYQGSGPVAMSPAGQQIQWAANDAAKAAVANAGAFMADPSTFVTAPDLSTSDWTLPASGDFTVAFTPQPRGRLIIRFVEGESSTYCVADATQSSLTIPAAAIAALSGSGNVSITATDETTATPTGSVTSRPIRHLFSVNRDLRYTK